MKSLKLVIPFHIISHCKLTFSYQQEVHLTTYDKGSSAQIISGKIYFLLLSENQLFHAARHNGMTSFMDFVPACFCLPDIGPFHAACLDGEFFLLTDRSGNHGMTDKIGSLLVLLSSCSCGISWGRPQDLSGWLFIFLL